MEGSGTVPEVPEGPRNAKVSTYSDGNLEDVVKSKSSSYAATGVNHKDETGRAPLGLTGLSFLALLVLWVLVVTWQLWQGQTYLWAVVYSLVFFEILNKALSIVALRPGFLSGLQSKHVDNFINTAVSLVHSTTISIAVVVLVYKEATKSGLPPMWQHVALTQNTWPGALTVLCVSCGYFAYDQWDMIRRRLYQSGGPSLLIHHVVLLTCFAAALFKNSCINYLILTLLCELHSIFLHIRKVTVLAGANRAWSNILRIEWELNWLTFFTARCAVHILITVKLLQDRHKFEKGTIEFPLAVVGMLGLNVLNFILGKGLWKAFKRERSSKRGSAKANED
ncbi:hypothetical protein R1sor_021190 [Riccia sorocarpa]|uniref:TLC domain-containing protein n=1 Tax=Riccia sorocarpa TaxID=122646 RepID=A0ABD3GKK4_9MARC